MDSGLASSSGIFVNNDLEFIFTNLQNISEIWEEMGMDPDIQLERKSHILNVLKSNVRDLEVKELQRKRNLEKQIDIKGLRLHELTTAMKLSDVIEPDSNFTLLQLDQYLEEKLLVLEETVKKRVEEFEELRKKEKELAERLGEDLCIVPSDKIPSEETLHHIQRVTRSLESEKVDRLRAYRSLKFKISSLMEDLEIDPTSPLEVNIVSGHEDLIAMSIDNIKALKTMAKNFQDQLTSSKDREIELLTKIDLLWTRLETSEEKKASFKAILTSKASRNIPILETELEEMEELKRMNLGHFINKLRRELEDWWVLIYFSDTQKEEFKPYFSDLYSEESLEDHEMEVSRMKKFYEENEDIFKKFLKWQELWKKFSEIESKGHDAKRLFGNRGCSLLQEEKERKKVNKQLPRIQEDIENAVDVYERKYKKTFTVKGKSVAVFFVETWEEFNRKKIKEKQERQSKRSEQVEHDARLGTKTCFKTPLGKRRNVARENHQTSKYVKTNENERKPSSSGVSSSSSMSRCSSRNNLFSPITPQRLPLSLRPSLRSRTERGQQTTFDSSDMAPYAKFQEDIHKRSERENVRSSAVIPAVNSPMKPPRGPPKTPASRAKLPPILSATRSRQPLTPTSNIYMNVTRSVTPSTLPRRRSARLNLGVKIGPKSCSRRPLNSPVFRTSVRCSPLATSKLSTPTSIKSKLSFLM